MMARWRAILVAGLWACWIGACWIGACWLGMPSRLALGQSAPVSDAVVKSPARDTLQYRRVLVPEDRFAELARGYMPLKRDEFAQHLARIRSAAANSEGASARVTMAEYHARLESGQLIDGQARLNVALAASGPALLSLDPCGLALADPPPGGWANGSLSIPDSGASRDEAAGNNASGDGPDGWVGMANDRRLWAWVPQSGPLDLAWTLRGVESEGGAWRLQLQLPASPCSRVWLDVPQSLRLTCDVGVMTPDPPATLSEQWSASLPAVAAPPPAGHRRWLLELGGHSAALVQVVPEDQPDSGLRAVDLRQATRYRLTPWGLELDSDLNLDIPLPSLERMSLVADAGLQITSVRYLGNELAWRSTPDPDGRWQHVEVEFDEPIRGADSLVQIAAIAPLATGRGQRLPTVRPKSVRWREASLRLDVAEGLVVREVVPQGCREVQADSLTASGAGGSREFHCYLPSASLQVLAELRRPAARIESGVRLRLEEEQLTAVFHGRLVALHGETFRLETDLPLAWEVEQVQLTPADALASYEVIPAGREPARLQRLVIHLNRAVPFRTALELSVRAGRRKSSNQLIRPADFRVFQFSGVTTASHLVALETSPRYRLRLAHDLDLQRLDPAMVSDDDARRIGGRAVNGLVFLDQPAADELLVGLEPIEPDFSVAIQMQATLQAAALEETYRLTCQPRSGEVQQWQVELSVRRESPVQWSVEGREADWLTARRLNADQSERAGETWLLELREPTTERIELRGRRTTPLEGPAELSLASVPAAGSQTGELEISSADGRAVQVEQQQMVRLPTARTPGNAYSATRARLRYEPSRGGQVRVALAPASTHGHTVWAWSYAVTSHWSTHGQARHEAELDLEQSGPSEVRLSWPVGLRLQTVKVDDDESAWPHVSRDEQRRELRVTLPAERRFVRLKLDYLTAVPRLGALQHLDAGAPQPDFPVLDRRWTVWLPSGFAPAPGLAALGSGWQWWPATSAVEPGLRARLLGVVSVAMPGQSASAANPLADPRPSAAAVSASPSPQAQESRTQAGWTHFDVPVTTSGEQRVTVYRTDWLRAAGWIAMLGVAGLLGAMFRGRPLACVPLIGVSAAIALLVPPVLVPLSSGVFLGSLAAGLLVMLSRPRVSRELAADDRTKSRELISGGRRWSVVVWTLIVLGLAGAVVQGQPRENRTEEKTPTGTIYRVLVRVDEDRQPVGEHEYLPLPFYEALLRRSATATGTPKGWLIRSAEYVGTIDLDAEPDVSIPGEITATYGLETFEADQRVRLDLGRRNVELRAARLDGAALQLTWLPDGKAIEVAVPRAGTHELQLTLGCLITMTAGQPALDLQVPQVANSRLSMQVLGDFQQAEVPAALGAVWVDRDRQSIRAELGPTSLLRVEWRREGAELAPMDVSAEELLWLKIKPNSVVVEAQVRLTARGGNIDEVTLLADPRLRLLRVEPPLAGRPTVRGGKRQTVVLKLAEPAGRECLLRASFLLDGGSGVGQISLPELEAVADRKTRRWAAVTCAASLQLATPDAPLPATLEPARFAQAWSGTPLAPDQAWQLDNLPAGWTFSTRFPAAVAVVDQQTRVTVGREALQLHYSATIENPAGAAAASQFELPADLELLEVAAETDTGRQPLDHFQGTNRRLTVFWTPAAPAFSDDSPPAVRMLLTGRIPVRRRQRFELPLVRPLDSQVRSQRVDIYRLPNAQAKIERLRGLADQTAQTEAAFESGRGRLVASLVGAAADPPIVDPGGVLTVTPNVPQRTARLVTRLDRVDGQWWAELDYRVEVRGGLLDLVRLEVPPEWSGPFEFSEPIPHSVQTLPGTSRRHLVIFPRSAVADTFSFRFRGSLVSNPNETDGLPDFLPLDVERAERFLIVPTAFNETPIEWVPSGLQPAAWPAGLPELPSSDYAIYRIVGARPRVTMRQGESTVDRPRVLLADIRFGWHSGGDLAGVATFDLQPAGKSAVTVRLPAGFEVVQARVGDRPAGLTAVAPETATASADDTLWRVSLATERLPQRLELVFQGRLPLADRAASWELPAPQLVGLPVERTMWTVRVVDSDRTFALGERQAEVTAATQLALRTRHLAGLLEATSPHLADSTQQEVDLWYGLWAARLAAARNQLGSEPAGDGASEAGEPAPDDWLPQLDARQAELAARLKTAALWDQWRQAPPRLQEAADSWQRAVTPEATVLSGTWPSGVDGLRLEVVPPRRADWIGRLAQAALVLGLAWLIWAGLARGLMQSWLAPSPQVAGILLGLGWWFFLWPAAIGWLIVAYSVCGVFRRPWQATRQSSTASTIVRRESAVRRR
ncbi:MAG: hypothetical protein J5I93_03155 [Pirellulaceae bacterium]|nr:hypothetical protein [Pirellulaceae bacterium]